MFEILYLKYFLENRILKHSYDNTLEHIQKSGRPVKNHLTILAPSHLCDTLASGEFSLEYTASQQITLILVTDTGIKSINVCHVEFN